jgi:hypothetical protein
VCNVVYAHLIASADPKTRDEFDSSLNAPFGGWRIRVIPDLSEGD